MYFKPPQNNLTNPFYHYPLNETKDMCKKP